MNTAFLANCPAQQHEGRPKIGLALSGGGACGLAHIGLLKVLEEEGLRPDYIAGVSMGALIGAFYTAGYTADSLENLCRRINWKTVVSNKIPENKIIIGEKKYFYNSIIALPITFRHIQLPSGLINGQQLENALNYYLWDLLDTRDFSMLPIPYMCLATDLVKCKQVNLTKGYLPDAVRASSAVPYIFTPYKIDSMLLVDGGVLRNYPAREVKNMGADIIIGCYTGSRFRTEAQLESVSEIMTQLGFYQSIFDYEGQKGLADYLVEPDIHDIPATEFEKYDTLIMRGYKAASLLRPRFRALHDSLEKLGPAKTIAAVKRGRVYVFDSITVKGNNLFSEDQIKGILDISPGDSVTRDRLNDRIDLLYGKNWFEKVGYRIIPGRSTILEINCDEKPKTMFYGSVHYDNTLGAGLLIGLNMKDPVTRGSQLDLNSFIGQEYRFSFSYIQFIDRNQKFNLSADFYADNTYITRLTLNGFTEGAYNRNLYYGLTLGKRVGLNHSLSLTGRVENIGFHRDHPTAEGKEKFKSNFATGEILFRSNTLNTKYFPDRGVQTEISVKASALLSATHITDTVADIYNRSGSFPLKPLPFYTLHGKFDQYFTKYPKWTFSMGGEFLLITQSDSVSEMFNSYFMGGQEAYNPVSVRAVGFHPFEISVNRMAELHLGIDYEIADKVHLNLVTGVAAMREINGSGEVSILPGIGLGAGYLSIIGPLRAGVMYGFYSNEQYFSRFKGYISIGYNF